MPVEIASNLKMSENFDLTGGFDHPADHKVLLFGQGLDRRPFGQ
jgi:hypothetical protein